MNIKKLPVHLHHIGSHFTNALVPVAALLLTVALTGGDPRFEFAAFACMVIGTLAVPVTYLSGAYDWRTRFQGRTTRIFTHKLIFGALFMTFCLAALAIRFTNPDLLETGGMAAAAYAGLVYAATGCAVYLGHLGSKFI